jgi:hydrogenase maturation factor HypF (carbamoyltransferase family)
MKSKKPKPIKTGICKVCGKEFTCNNNSWYQIQTACSKKCGQESTRIKMLKSDIKAIKRKEVKVSSVVIDYLTGEKSK